MHLGPHCLTVDELARHYHQSGLGWLDPDKPSDPQITDTVHGQCNANRPNITWNSGSTGGDKPHNTIQPSKAVYIWLRTA